MPWRHAPAPVDRVTRPTGPTRPAGPTVPGHAAGTAPPAPGDFVPVELAQTSPRDFTLRADLVYEERPGRRAGAPGGPGRRHVVPAGFTTDLTSVPYPLWAIIAPFGRQTRAAILHDHGVRSLRPPLRSPERLREREALDLLFRDALLDSDVPRLRAFLLWAGTSLDRIVRHAPVPVAVALVVQLAAGLACFLAAARVGGPAALGLLLLPLVAALAWGRSRLAIALAQYVGAFVLPAMVLNAVVAAVLALASLVVGGRAQGIAPTRLPGPGGASGSAD